MGCLLICVGVFPDKVQVLDKRKPIVKCHCKMVVEHVLFFIEI